LQESRLAGSSASGEVVKCVENQGDLRFERLADATISRLDFILCHLQADNLPIDGTDRYFKLQFSGDE
jgi:hypothetical protein